MALAQASWTVIRVEKVKMDLGKILNQQNHGEQSVFCFAYAF